MITYQVLVWSPTITLVVHGELALGWIQQYDGLVLFRPSADRLSALRASSISELKRLIELATAV